MKKNINKILCSFIVLLFILVNAVFAVEFEIVEAPYTEEYEKYLQLTDEEKAKVLEPAKYDIKNTIKTTNEALLANERITVKNLKNLLRASATSSDTKFSLKDIIGNNVVIKNQYQTGTCWTFAALSSLETNLALNNYNNNLAEVIYDYSERHMAYAKSQTYSDKNNEYGWDYTVSGGGTIAMSTSYLSDGQGAVSEEDMPFENNENTILSSLVEDLNAETTVDSIIWFDHIYTSKATADEITDIQTAIKEHIVNYGAVYASINSSTDYINYETGAIYNNGTNTSDHAISIIGWDDNYSKDNFNTAPTSNGAWIIKNSWGEKSEYTYEEIIEAFKEYGYSEATIEANWNTIVSVYTEAGYTNDEENELFYLYYGVSEENGGEGYGYFYVSYEDYTIYSNCYGIVSADDEVTYDNIYQLDELGACSAYYYSTKSYNLYMANVFTRETTEKEYLTSVGITNYASGTYEVYINPNGTGKTSEDLIQATFEDGSKQITLTAGYNTIYLKEAFELTGTNFVIVMKEIADRENYLYIPIEYANSSYHTSNATSNSGESFVTFDTTDYFGSDYWVDIGDTSDSTNYYGNLCIKGFTLTSYSGTVANGEDSTDDDGDNENETGNETANETGNGNETGNETANETGNETVNETGNETENENGNETVNETGNETENETTNETTNETSKETDSNIKESTVVNNDYSNAVANLTYYSFNSNSEYEMIVKITGIIVEDEEETYEHYFYLSSDSNADTDSVASSKWTKVDSFDKQDDGTYTITLTITQDTYQDDVDASTDYMYIYIKEIATNSGATSTIVSEGFVITANVEDLKTSNEDGNYVATSTEGNNTNSQKDNTTTSDNTTSTSGLPYTGIKTLLIILSIGSIIAAYTYIKYKNLSDI